MVATNFAKDKKQVDTEGLRQSFENENGYVVKRIA